MTRQHLDWSPDGDMPLVVLFADEDPEATRSHRAVLADVSSTAAWTADTDTAVTNLIDMVEQFSRQLAEVGLPPATRIDPHKPSGKWSATLTNLIGRLTLGDPIAWTVDLSQPGAMAAALVAGVPGIAEINGSITLVPKVASVADHVPADRTATDEAATAAARCAVDSAITEIAGRVADAGLRYRLRDATVDTPHLLDLLCQLPANDPDLMQAGTALTMAIRALADADNPAALLWVGRVDDCLAGQLGDVNADLADAITLVWVDTDDGISTGNVGRLTADYRRASQGGATVAAVYTARDGRLVEVPVTLIGAVDVNGGSATVTTVTVTLPDGSVLQDSYQADATG